MAKRYKNVNGVRTEMTSDEVKEMEATEKAWKDEEPHRNLDELRTFRNNLLAETDWMANSDYTMTDEWKKYRQDLRDITKTFKSMGRTVEDKDFKFPTKPDAE